MDSDSFILKWSDHQSTVIQSFELLRREKDFYDVTLVSDDQQTFCAHKLVLSACSNFFRNILKNNLHSHPLLYLYGIKAEDLKQVRVCQCHVTWSTPIMDIDKGPPSAI